ncbi:histidine kinase dimerization/phosphoacceptor domain -containing protein [Phenylobacterium sp.]|jgi:PAS domain S-box-containing protein|uniref:histidine kinase dimerization/phosphoacceptor domain -containing protein n=1 Tax=Phenylobacterium sp. TaxID=1871053 RepID=UPI002F941E5C
MTNVKAAQRAGRALDAEHATDDPFAAAIRGTRMPIVITDARQADNPIIFANDAFLGLTGYGREEVIGRNCRFLQGPETDPATLAQVRDSLAAGQDVTVELANYRKDGRLFWNQLFVSPVRNDAGEIVYFFGSQFDVTARRAAQDAEREHLKSDIHVRARELEAALEQKTSLLHEVDHRVKNNLQLISSLLLLQTRRTPEESTRKALRSMLERVGAIATVHRRLFQGGDVQRFDVADFLRDLAADLAASARRDDLQLRLDLEPVAVPASQAAPLALLANELVSNALKHPYPEGTPGVVTVAVRRYPEAFDLVVADTGPGLPPPTERNGFGLTIIQLLAQQLKAKLVFEDTQPGLRAVVTMPTPP